MADPKGKLDKDSKITEESLREEDGEVIDERKRLFRSLSATPEDGVVSGSSLVELQEYAEELGSGFTGKMPDEEERERIESVLSEPETPHKPETEEDEEPYTTYMQNLGERIFSMVIEVNQNTANKLEAEKAISVYMQEIKNMLFEMEEAMDNPPLFMLKDIRKELLLLKGEINRSRTSFFNKESTNFARMLRRSLTQLYNRFHPRKKLPTSETNPVIESSMLQFSKNRDVETLRKIKEIGKCVERGELRRAMKLQDEICNTFQNYQKLYGIGQHNFMTPSDNPDDIMLRLLKQIYSNPIFQEFAATKNRVLELGSGFGNDAVLFVKHFPNIIGYHGIDAYRPGIEKTMERLRRLKDEGFEHLEFDIEHRDFIKWMIDPQHYPEFFPTDERLIVHSKSTLHYNLLPIFKQIVIPNLFRIAFNGRGMLSLHMKTPESPTWDEHVPIYNASELDRQDGYLCGIHEQEGQLRVAITQNKLVTLLEEGGFDVIRKDDNGQALKDRNGNYLTDDDGNILISENAVVQRVEARDYDHDDQTEILTSVLARPKRVHNNLP